MSTTSASAESTAASVPSTNGSSTTAASNKASTASSTGASQSPRVITVDMTSDNICPWCYIGKRRLERAIAELDPARVTVRIRMHPFFLDATLPPSSVNKMEHYKKKFGAERAAQMIPRMQATGREEGIAFSYGGNIGNTLLSHRLVRYTERTRPDATNGLVDALFRAYFEEEKDIADIPTLAAIAASQGFDEAVVAEYLRGREDEAAVQNEVINAYRQGIDGVPNFKFENQYEVSGGEKPATFLEVFKRLGVA